MINTNKSKSNSKAVLFTKIIIFFVTIVTIFLAKTYGVQTGNKSAPMKDPIMNDLTSFNDLVNQNE